MRPFSWPLVGWVPRHFADDIKNEMKSRFLPLLLNVDETLSEISINSIKRSIIGDIFICPVSKTFLSIGFIILLAVASSSVYELPYIRAVCFVFAMFLSVFTIFIAAELYFYAWRENTELRGD